MFFAIMLNSYQKKKKDGINNKATPPPYKTLPLFSNLPIFKRFSQSTSFFHFFENLFIKGRGRDVNRVSFSSLRQSRKTLFSNNIFA